MRARAHKYDGASNMMGKHKGCGAILKKVNPLLLQFHCQAHAANLVVQAAADSSDLIKNSIAVVHELSKLSKGSIKVRQQLQSECEQLAYPDSGMSVKCLRPLCPTKWLCRFKPIKATVDNYKALISGMEKIVENKLLSTTTGQSKAQGILSSLRKPQTFLGLCAIIKPLALLEQLSLTLQGEEVDIDSTEQAIRTVEETITKYRVSEFEASFQEMNDLITEVSSMTPLKLPRQRVLGTADIKKHYRIQFVQFIDMISVELKARFSVEDKSVDLGKNRELCTVFKEGEFPKSLRDYKELDYMKLKAEATRFREVTGVSSLHEAKLAYRGMNDMERAFFPQVFEFMKILLACPVSSSTAERSFSALRRLKLG